LANFLPEGLVRSLSKLDHFDAAGFRSVHDSAEQLVSIHFNSVKPVVNNGSWQEKFSGIHFQISGKVPWAPDAFYLESRPSFTLDPFFHAGSYYVQEASGMFLSFALKQIADLSKKLKVLDLCAAPGGKSTLIQSLISPESLLVSNEVIKTRVPVLHQNMTKWGRLNGFISHDDPAHFKLLPGFFDLVVIDAPCSGSGLFRKDPKAASAWSQELVNLCSQRQKRIMSDAWHTLKEGGFMIYSTCSYSKEENEDVLDHFFQKFDCTTINLSPNPEWQIIETFSDLKGVRGYRFYPGRVKGEGFFLSVIQKIEPVDSNQTKNIYQRANNAKRQPERISKPIEKQLTNWIKAGICEYFPVGDAIHALEPGMFDDFTVLKNALYLKRAGVRIGKPVEDDWIPDHELALADILNDKPVRLNLENPEALSFLRGESFEMGMGERGWRLVCYRDYGLGWVKMLDKRLNNYYPKSWRIRI
jgi:16S rRNA C967 or C1407 C5-methylase (RsmB/RsmF family)/NOL1/NOP2/fmu family ribosome biogenesis protein